MIVKSASACHVPFFRHREFAHGKDFRLERVNVWVTELGHPPKREDG
jgi:hypothetical protein